MEKKIVIVGAGGFGREVFSWLQHWRAGKSFPTIGFLDDREDATAAFKGLPPVIGRISNYIPSDNERLVCALGNPKAKIEICEALKKRGGLFLTLVHPSAVVGDRVQLGVGVVVAPMAVLTCDIAVDDFVTVNAAATVGHDARLGAGTTLSGHCDVTGGVTVGRGVFFGSHAAALPGVSIGDFATVGAGSVVVRDVKPGATVFGVPAKQIAGF